MQIVYYLVDSLMPNVDKRFASDQFLLKKTKEQTKQVNRIQISYPIFENINREFISSLLLMVIDNSDIWRSRGKTKCLTWCIFFLMIFRHWRKGCVELCNNLLLLPTISHSIDFPLHVKSASLRKWLTVAHQEAYLTSYSHQFGEYEERAWSLLLLSTLPTPLIQIILASAIVETHQPSKPFSSQGRNETQV